MSELSKPTGLLNLGSTCYANSIIQVLFLTRQFRTYVMLEMTEVPYWATMSALIADMTYGFSHNVNPSDFIVLFKPPYFKINHQYDSLEFLEHVLKVLQTYEIYSNLSFKRMPNNPTPPSLKNDRDDESGVSSGRFLSPRPGRSGLRSNRKRTAKEDIKIMPRKKRRQSVIDFFFGGSLLTITECLQCHYSTVSREVFHDLKLSFPEKQQPRRLPSVQNLLRAYFSKETLSGENRYLCPGCHGLNDANRSVSIDSAPKHLILALKNFRFDPNLRVYTKLMTKIYYNHVITLPTYQCHRKNNYDLYAAVIHCGTTIDRGHYYTFAKDGEQWNIYDDDLVVPCRSSYLQSLSKDCTPYILFYRRTDIKEAAVPNFDELPERLRMQVLKHKYKKIGLGLQNIY